MLCVPKDAEKVATDIAPIRPAALPALAAPAPLVVPVVMPCIGRVDSCTIAVKNERASEIYLCVSHLWAGNVSRCNHVSGTHA